MSRVEILATGPELIKGGIRGTWPVIEEIINSAEREIQVLAYVLTAHAIPVLDMMEDAASRGIKLIMIVNHFELQQEIIQKRLRSLSARFGHVRIFNFADPEGRQLHAKIIVVDRKKAVLGSANFSWGGMYGNYEIGLFMEGELVWKLAGVIDLLSQNCRLIK